MIRRFACLVALVIAASSRVATAQVLTPDDVSDLPIPVLRAAEDRQRSLDNIRGRTDIVQAGPINAETYLLGPGDELEISLWGRVSRTIPLVVSPEGRIFLPGRGMLDVGGKSLAWVRDRIQKSMIEQFVGVRSDVRLTRLRTFKVYLGGEVKTPGSLEVNSATRANEAIAQSGGLTDVGTRRNILILHLDGTRNRVDLELFERLGRHDMNPVLLDGDRILVPRSIEYVDLAGALVRPGRFDLTPGDSLGTLLDLAGGLLPSSSAEQALMVRFTSATDRESLFVDMGSHETRTMLVRDGDRLFVNFRPEYHRLATVGITGEIERPGTYPIVPGRDRLSDLIHWAGGFRPQANRAAVHLLRESPRSSERDPELDRLARLSRDQMTESEYTRLETKLAERKNSFRIDLSRLEAGSSADPLLQEEDVVRIERFVPSVRIEGQVKRPGLVDYAAGRSLGEYIQLVGGFTERSARTSIRVSRSLTGQIVPARSLRNVQPGDFIWVPERRDVDAWAAFRDVVTVAGQVALIIFTLSR